jgi:hypothetical protein
MSKSRKGRKRETQSAPKPVRAGKPTLSNTVVDKLKSPKRDPRKEAAKGANVSERDGYAQTIKKNSPQEPTKERWSKSKKILATLLAVATIVGGLAAVVTFLPRVTIDFVDTEDTSDTISSHFTIIDTNFIPLEDLNVSIGLCRLQVSFKSFNGDDQPVNLVTNGQKDVCDYSKISFLTVNTWLKHRLEMDERYTIDLSEYFKTYAMPLKLMSGDIAMVVDFKPWIWPRSQKRYFRFVTEMQKSGRVRWIAKPLDLK